MGKARVCELSGKPATQGGVIDAQGVRDARSVGGGLMRAGGGADGVWTAQGVLALACLGGYFGGSFSGGGAYAPTRRPEPVVNNMMAILIDPNVVWSGRSFGVDVDSYTIGSRASPAAPDNIRRAVSGGP